MNLNDESRIAALEGLKTLYEEKAEYFSRPWWAHPVGEKFPYFAGDCVDTKFRISEIDQEIRAIENGW